MNPDIRWKQRFHNFDRALDLLREAMRKGTSSLSPLEKEGVIQRFEYTFELAWKTLKDYMEQGGVVISPVTPRQVIKEAFGAKILQNGQAWMEMLDHRNLLSHTYELATFEAAVEAIASKYPELLNALHMWLLEHGAK